ncbi:hypothetical protein [Rhodohalobacter mucosus]|uniref:Uncharacterized protein n=1 Tax=Rhodohalobacter mucosus TaxID=2079485 RepID=A0A316TVA9_9BACT|nr:hypothetical protein [Rhodohalobacter mucosus]PWN07219.1 hypothetical protein DDZ15_05315 [Rhodohalobacter mucosus]
MKKAQSVVPVRIQVLTDAALRKPSVHSIAGAALSNFLSANNLQFIHVKSLSRELTPSGFAHAAI